VTCARQQRRGRRHSKPNARSRISQRVILTIITTPPAIARAARPSKNGTNDFYGCEGLIPYLFPACNDEVNDLANGGGTMVKTSLTAATLLAILLASAQAQVRTSKRVCWICDTTPPGMIGVPGRNECAARERMENAPCRCVFSAGNRAVVRQGRTVDRCHPRAPKPPWQR
jgi:hypothetical protein